MPKPMDISGAITPQERDAADKQALHDAIAKADAKPAPKPFNRDAYAHARSQLQGVVSRLKQTRNGAEVPDAEERAALIADAVRDLPERMSSRIKDAANGLFRAFDDGERNFAALDEKVRGAAAGVAGTAPTSFVTPDSNPNRDDDSVEDILARVPRA